MKATRCRLHAEGKVNGLESNVVKQGQYTKVELGHLGVKLVCSNVFHSFRILSPTVPSFHIVSYCFSMLHSMVGIVRRAQGKSWVRQVWMAERNGKPTGHNRHGWREDGQSQCRLVQSGWGQQICRDAIWPLARKRRFEGWLQYVRRLLAQSVHAADWLSCSHSSYCFFPLGSRRLWQFCTFEC